MDYLEEVRRALGLEQKVQEATRDVVERHLRFALASEYLEREFELILTLQEGKTHLLGMIESEEGDIDLLQFLYASPRAVDAEHRSQTLRLVHMLNKLSPLPGFGWDEVDSRTFFRYAQPLTPKSHSPKLIKSLVTCLGQILDLYIPTLEDVGQGVADLDELLLEAKSEMMGTFQSMTDLLDRLEN